MSEHIYDYVKSYTGKDFESVRTLHSGERGSVMLLKHRTSGQPYVLREYEGSAEVYRQLIGTGCRSLPAVYEAAEKDGRAIVLEEYIRGDTLHEMLRGSLFSFEDTRRIVTDICGALCVLHGLGAVHRDIKPENVILTGHGAVLIDLDSSRIYKEYRSTDTVVLGTTGFAAPEQYGMGQTDPRSDIYSLCVMMNFMLTGKHPSTELASGRAGRIIKKGTMVNPEDRYRDIIHFLEAL